jgi:hypothetical protein
MEKLSSATKIKKYRVNSWRVPGWFPLVDFDLFQAINKSQQELGCLGDILEIGTYKGKSGILLTLCAGPTETVRLLDLYADVRLEANPDSIDYKKLDENQTIKNLKKFGSEYELVFSNSLEIPKVIPKIPHRIIHIDGSHQYEVVRNDLQNALNLLSPEGVIVLDDYSNFAYPGVARAFWEFYENHEIGIICATPARIYVAKKQYISSYQLALKELSLWRSSISLGPNEDLKFNLINYKGRKRLIQKVYSFLSLFMLWISRIR